MKKILLVDDEPNLLSSLEIGLARENWSFLCATSGKEGLERFRKEKPNLALLDMRLPDMSGLEWINKVNQIDPTFPIIVMTAFATTETAIEAMKSGAFEYLTKPLDLQQLHRLVEKGLGAGDFQRIPVLFEEEFSETETDPAVNKDRIIGKSSAMNEIYKSIGRIAPLDVSVLIMGESGTGKELVARSIYQHGPRHAMPFLAINCAAIPEALLESELFGHERGAFSGAERRRIGKFEQVNGGTLFLDEIGDMTSATQAKILRVLQEQRFERLGGNETISVDVRIIGATNRNLDQMTSTGQFREDLLYRLNGFAIRLPPLRERMEDLPLLCRYFVHQFARKLNKPSPTIPPETLARLMAYHWPGNIRELQATLRFGMIQSFGPTLFPESLPAKFTLPQAMEPVRAEVAEDSYWEKKVRALLEAGTEDIYWKLLETFDQAVLDCIMKYVQGNQVQASQILGLSRNTLRSKLAQFPQTKHSKGTT